MDQRRPDPRRTDPRRADPRRPANGRRPVQKKKRRRRSTFEQLKPVLVCLIVVVLFVLWRVNAREKTPLEEPTPTAPPIQSEIIPEDESLEHYAEENGLSMSEWPENLVELYNLNPDAREYVKNYPRDKDKTFPMDLTGLEKSNVVPLLFQWDQRWGYTIYGDDVMALTACGPTCLSMACIYLLKDAKFTPRYVADFSQNEGYYVPGSGSAWTLISEGGEKLGLDVEELPLGKQVMLDALNAGELIICSMKPGIFTRVGHFILMIGTEDGKFQVNDPNSIIRSRTLWDYDDIKDQIGNLWAIRAAN